MLLTSKNKQANEKKNEQTELRNLYFSHILPLLHWALEAEKTTRKGRTPSFFHCRHLFCQHSYLIKFSPLKRQYSNSTAVYPKLVKSVYCWLVCSLPLITSKEGVTTKYFSGTSTVKIFTQSVILTKGATTLSPLSLLTIQRTPRPFRV